MNRTYGKAIKSESKTKTIENRITSDTLLKYLKFALDNENELLNLSYIQQLINGGINLNFKDANKDNALFYVINFRNFSIKNKNFL